MKEVLGFLDMLGAFVMIWANQRITRRAGIRGKIAQWALLRRMMYLAAAFALFYVGVAQLGGVEKRETLAVGAHAILLLYVVLFPLLRALGWITQDMLTSEDD